MSVGCGCVPSWCAPSCAGLRQKCNAQAPAARPLGQGNRLAWLPMRRLLHCSRFAISDLRSIAQFLRMLAVFRDDDEEASLVNVKPFVALLHSTAEGLAVPLPVVGAHVLLPCFIP